MSSIIESAVKQGQSHGKLVRSRFQREAGGLTIPEGGLAAGGIAINPSEQYLNQYREQREYRSQEQRFRGWPYAAVRPIAQTIAGQSFMLAKAPAGQGNTANANRGTLRKDAGKRNVMVVPHRGVFRVPDFIVDAVKRPAEGLDLYDSHPLLDLLQHPNQFMVRWQLLYCIVGSLELTGWSHLWLTEDQGRRVVWPLPTSWVTPVHMEGNTPKPFARWEVRPGGYGEPIPVPGEEIIPIAYTNPSHLLGATSPLGAQEDAVLTDESIQRAQREVMENSIWPRYAIIAGDLDDPDDLDSRGIPGLGRPLLEQWQREELHDILKQLYGGTLHAGEPLIFDRLIRDVKELGNKPAEMDFEKGGDITRKRILTGFGTSGFIIGETEPHSRAASAMSRMHFADFTINPKIELISQILTVFFAPRLAVDSEPLYLWIDYYEPEDREQTRKDVELAVKARAINRDEVRETLRGLAHLPPLKDGQNCYVPAIEELVPLVAADNNVSKSVQPLEGKAFEEAAMSLWDKSQAAEEADLIPVIEDLFEQQRVAVVRNLEAMFGDRAALPKSTEGLADLLFHPAEWYELWHNTLYPDILGVAVRGALEEQILFDQANGKAVDPYMELPPDVAPHVRNEVDTIMARPYWREIHDTTREQLAATINEGMANGESLYELSVRIGVSPTVPGANPGVLGADSNTIRAKLIARTETTGALNAGHFATQMGLRGRGLIEKKQWLSLVDAMTRPTHAALHLVKIPVLAMFDVGGEPAPYPGHFSLSGRERCNCRCTSVSVVK